VIERRICRWLTSRLNTASSFGERALMPIGEDVLAGLSSLTVRTALSILQEKGCKPQIRIDMLFYLKLLYWFLDIPDIAHSNKSDLTV
jgi:hypothetical protein